MARKLLIALLIISLLIELALTAGVFFATQLTMNQFGVPLNADTEFPAYIIGWLLLFVSLACGVALRQVWRRSGNVALCYVLGLWWVGIGIGIYAAFGKADNLLLDSVKGLLLLVLTYSYSRKHAST